MIVDKPKKYDAILSLHPDAQFVLDKDHLMWHSANIPQPSDDAIATELARLEAEHAATQYQRDRKELYPTFEDVIVSLAEKTEGYSDDMWKQIKAKRKEVREGNPKPAGRQAADTEFQTRRQSAIDKLVALGLTAEEIEAIIL